MTVSRILLLGLAALTATTCSASTVLENVPQLPQGWRERKDEAVDPNSPLQLSFALRQPSICEAHRAIMSDQRLSQARASQLQEPDQTDIDSVMKWLQDHGITNGRVRHGQVQATMPVGKAQKMLDMQIHNFQYKDRKLVQRTQKYAVPDELAKTIDFVHPVANFMKPESEILDAPGMATPEDLDVQQRDKRDTAGDDMSGAFAPCARLTTPSCIRKMYQMPAVQTNGTADCKATFGIAGFLEQNANSNDIHSFLDATAPDIAATDYNYTTELIKDGENSQDAAEAGKEAALDMEYAMALAYPTKITFYSTGGRGVSLDDQGQPQQDSRNEPFLDLVQYLLDKPDQELPQVLSISYADDELSVPKSYATRVCNMFSLLTARGVTILAGSGDGGAQGGRDSTCMTNDGTHRQVAMATFPGTCPWVTSVGSTTAAVSPPGAATFSGGGFSQYFDQPDWQSSVIPQYVKELNGHLEGKYNASMRAVPDLSIIGTQFAVQVGGQPIALQGTSASSPVFGSMISLINEDRLEAGKPVLGWLNKRIYQDAVKQALVDVTTGESQSCEWDGQKPGGWRCAEGWDAVTGVGTVGTYEALKAALMD